MASQLLAAVWLLFCQGISAVNAAPSFQTHALLIGIDQYENSHLIALEGAKNDVTLVKQILMDRFQVDEANIATLIDEKATHVAIRDAFKALADKLKPGDMAYIHYSGHGSFTCDLNGDEAPSWGKDSTWVPFGARSSGGENAKDCPTASASESMNAAALAVRSIDPGRLNDFDILDDEINRWLAALTAKTDNVIFVSDSCHSGTVTRSNAALATRGAPMDFRAHPLGGGVPIPFLTGGVRVSACRDSEKANEYNANGDIHGLFTWFWCRSLQEARPGDAWHDIHRRTAAHVSQWRSDQHPQIEGDRRQTVFGGGLMARPRTAAVTYASYNGKEAKIDEGSLLGATPGSVYRLFEPVDAKAASTTFTIVQTEPARSRGTVEGRLRVGDQVVLDRYNPDGAPARILVRADLETDAPLARKLASAVEKRPIFAVSTDQRQSDFILHIARPKKENGCHVYAGKGQSLPKSFPDQPPQCWILRPDEHLFHPDLTIDLTATDQGVPTVCRSLEKIVQAGNLIALTSALGRASPVKLTASIWEIAPPDSSWGLEAEGKKWRNISTAPARGMAAHDLKVDQLLTFSIQNNADVPYFTYLVNIAPDGRIIPFYPTPFQSREHGRIGPGQTRDIRDVTLYMDQPGREYVRLIASRKPIDIHALGQSGYRKTRGRRGNMTELDILLQARVGLTRSRPKRPLGTAEWTTVLSAFLVER